MNILGISCFHHDSSACLITKDNIYAAQEERFNRSKYSEVFPSNAIRFCLKAANIKFRDIDYVGFYERPYLKFKRVVLNYLKTYPFSLPNFLTSMPQWLDQRLIFPLLLKEEFGEEKIILYGKHHLSHAASSFLVSPFSKAAILTVDGIGEYTSATYGIGKGNKIFLLKEMCYPNSLGFLYSIITAYLGFRVFSGEGKVMALAQYGEPEYVEHFKKEVVDIKEDGSFSLNPDYFWFNRGNRMYSNKFVKVFGPPRREGDIIKQRHYNMAATLQNITEEILIKMARFVYSETKVDKLCAAGGVFLNVTANTRILQETPFNEIFVQPAAGDAGTSLGVAKYIQHSLFNIDRDYIMTTAYLGPEFSNSEISNYLTKEGIRYTEFEDVDLVKYIARQIYDNKIVGWFQGRMEWGPRALGNRSILANPCNPEMKDILNYKVKHREPFRPYGISILREELSDFFSLDIDSPFMLFVGKVRPSKKSMIPSALHVDETSRIQTVTRSENGIYYELIKEFRKISGVPLIINTSFNDKGKPIVCSPKDACECFFNTKMDFLVLGNCVIKK